MRSSCIPLLGAKMLAALLILLAAVTPAESGNTVTLIPLNGQSFMENDTFRIRCKSRGTSQFSLRLNCPLSRYAEAETSCFESCHSPLCATDACRQKVPELQSIGCTINTTSISDSVQETVIDYEFRAASLRLSGYYGCMFASTETKTNIVIRPAPITTASITRTTSTPVSTVSTVTVRPVTSAATARPTPDILVTSRNTQKIFTMPPPLPTTKTSTSPTTTTTTTTTTSTTTAATLGNAGWFSSQIAGNLKVSDLILVLELLMIILIWIIGFACIRCNVRKLAIIRKYDNTCCSKLLCLPQAEKAEANGGANGLARADSRLEAIKPLTLSDAQEYAEPSLDAGYYSPADPDNDQYYRLQTEFEREPNFGGSQRGLHPKSTFFSRELPGRHSFHNIRSPRQRGQIPLDLVQGVGELEQQPEYDEQSGISKEEFQRQVVQQRKEIESLRQQLRNSQLQLSRITESQQDLRRSISASKIRQEQPPPAGEYELLSRSAAASAPTPAASGLVRGSADVLSVDPIAEEAGDGTLRRKRQGSISEAFEAGGVLRS